MLNSKNDTESSTEKTTIGKKIWAIAEGFIPGWSNGVTAGAATASHEAVCILNPTNEDARLEITIYFADRQPVGPYILSVSVQRTKHVRFDELEDLDIDYGSIIRSDIPVIVQHTRLDSRQAENALLTTIGCRNSYWSTFVTITNHGVNDIS